MTPDEDSFLRGIESSYSDLFYKTEEEGCRGEGDFFEKIRRKRIVEALRKVKESNDKDKLVIVKRLIRNYFILDNVGPILKEPGIYLNLSFSEIGDCDFDIDMFSRVRLLKEDLVRVIGDLADKGELYYNLENASYQEEV